MLDPQERSEMLVHFQNPRVRPGRADAVDSSYLQLTADQFHVVSDWHYFAILNLISIKGFRSDPAWIAVRLGVSQSMVESALERLKRLEMVKEDGRGRLSRAKPRYRTTDDIANLSLRKSHHQTLDLAKEALDSEPIDRRDFTWLTFPISARKLPVAKAMIRKFQDEILASFEGDADCDEVYRLAIQLFSLTKGNRK